MTVKQRHSTQRTGFTLIELLVVIAILGLLVSILLPSLRGARQSAKNTQCLARLRGLFTANAIYIGEEGKFPDMNNEEDDGAWQYNYLIFDDHDFDQNFGPLIAYGRVAETLQTGQDFRPIVGGGVLDNVEQLFCPVQTDPFHSLSTPVNPWPVVPLFDTRAGYGRRYHLSGKNLSQFKGTIAFAADILHLPSVIKTGHKTGVNVVYIDGHARWVFDKKRFLGSNGQLRKNELAHPFDIADNDIMEDIWDALDEAP